MMLYSMDQNTQYHKDIIQSTLNQDPSKFFFSPQKLQANFKICMELEGPRADKAILKKKSKAGGLPDRKL